MAPLVPPLSDKATSLASFKTARSSFSRRSFTTAKTSFSDRSFKTAPESLGNAGEEREKRNHYGELDLQTIEESGNGYGDCNGGAKSGKESASASAVEALCDSTPSPQDGEMERGQEHDEGDAEYEQETQKDVEHSGTNEDDSPILPATGRTDWVVWESLN
ncbi:hypothetical protein BKA81DRAFT_402741 [Phyllosticta paracitricarpa]